MVYPVYVSNEKFENCMDLYLIADKNKSHYVHIKYFDRYMCNKTKHDNKKHFCKCCLQCLSSEKVLREHKETYLKINSKQSVKLKSGFIEFKSYFKELAVPFKIYANFESLLKGVQSNIKHNSSYTKNIKIFFLAVLLTELFVLMIDLANQLLFTEEKMQSIDLLKQFLKKKYIANK